MDVCYPAEAEAYREKVRAFLGEHLPPGWRGIGALDEAGHARFVDEWRSTLYEHGLLGISWPVEYGGGGLSSLEQVVQAEEFARAGVPPRAAIDNFGIKMLGNTLLRWGTEDQKRRLLPRILSGEDVWCQGYSEPDAGSDLGGLTTRAVLDGDEWVIDGQKIWTSGAHLANWIFLLARTDATAPKHQGISFLLCPMDQRGIEVRPIRMITGADEFNGVFFTGARTAADNIVGEVNGGWAVAMTLLGFERGEEASLNPILFRAELDRLLELVRARGAGAQPVLRDRLAACYVDVEVMRYLGYRVLTAFLAGGAPGPESSVLKLFWSQYHQRVTDLAMDVLGPSAFAPAGRGPARAFRADDPGTPPENTASWAGVFLNARAGTIYAGSSEIHRTTIGERILGLPKEPRPS